MDQLSTRRLIKLFIVAFLLLLCILQNELTASSEVKGQIGVLNNSIVINNNKSESGGSKSSPATSSKDDNVTAVAKKFTKQLRDMAKQRKESTNGSLSHQYNKRQTIINSFDIDEDADLMSTKDNGKEDIPTGSIDFDGNNEHKLIKIGERTGQKQLKIKASDFVIRSLPPSVSFRSGKSGKHYTTNNGISSTDRDNRVLKLIKSSASLPKFIINQSLHSKNRPSVSFDIKSNAVMFIFEVDKEESKKYFLSVMVEKMNCKTFAENETVTPKLYIGGMEHEVSFCKKFDYSLNNYQSVEYLINGEKFVSVVGRGDWTNTSASLVVSIYTETYGCQYCPVDHFCCGRKDTACKNSEDISDRGSPSSSLNSGYPKPKEPSKRYRCIPKLDTNGASMICNGHPNCGFHCNLDELGETCPKIFRDEDNDNEEGDECPGYTCREYQQQDRFMITLLLLILFCVFVPFCIFLFFCGRKDIRRELGRWGRCPLPLELIFCPFSINADDPNPNSPSTAPTAELRTVRNGTQTQTRGIGRRPIRRAEEVNSGIQALSGVGNPGFFDDLPPSYSECCSNKELFPNPPTAFTSNCNGSVIRSSNNFRTTRETPTTASAFQLQPIMSLAQGTHRINEVEEVTSPSQNQNTTTSLTSDPSRCQVDAISVIIRTTNDA